MKTLQQQWIRKRVPAGKLKWLELPGFQQRRYDWVQTMKWSRSTRLQCLFSVSFGIFGHILMFCCWFTLCHAQIILRLLKFFKTASCILSKRNHPSLCWTQLWFRLQVFLVRGEDMGERGVKLKVRVIPKKCQTNQPEWNHGKTIYIL